MQNTRAKLAIFAFAAMFGCTVQSPLTTPSTVQVKLQLPATEATYSLTRYLTQRFSDEYDEPGFEVETRAYHTLMQQLNQGTISYFTSSHIPAGTDLWAAPLAVDGLTFIVNQHNPLTDLRIDDLRDVLAGRIVDWGDLGRFEMPITPFTISADSDVYREVERMLTGPGGITGNARLVPGFGAMLAAVATEPGAIGFAPLALIDDSVKVLAIDGILPAPDNVGRQVYPLRSTIFVIGRVEPPPAYRNLVGWIQSDAGQAIVAESHTALP